MKIKTSELTGTALDWAVAKCEGVVGQDGNPVLFRFTGSGRYGVRRNPGADFGHYQPQTWMDGGPIIEREKLGLLFNWMPEDRSYWSAILDDGEYRQSGPTPLVAAMRCFIASRLGDEVDVPEELLE